MRLRFAWRFVRRQPRTALGAFLSLLLGIGLTAAAWSLVYGVVFKPLRHFEAPRNLVVLWGTAQPGDLQDVHFSEVDLAAYRDTAKGFKNLAGFEETAVQIEGGRRPGSRAALKVTRDYFDVVRVRPLHGRLPLAGEQDAVVLSEAEWERQIGGAFSGARELVIDGRRSTVVGVWPTFRGLGVQPRVWLFFQGDEKPFQFRAARSLLALGRLKPDVPIKDAQQELQSIAATLGGAFPETNANMSVRLVSLRDQLIGDAKLALHLLLAAIGLVLFLACFNAGKILLANLIAREREWAIRRMLGSGRMRLFGLLLGEAGIVAVPAAALGTALAYWALPALLAQLPFPLPRADEVAVDLGTVALAAAIAAGFSIGVPLLGAGRIWKASAMRPAMGTDARAGRFTQVLSAAEIAIALPLLIGASLLAQSFLRLSYRDFGFDPRHVVAVTFRGLPNNPQRQQELWRELIAAAADWPETRAAAATFLPIHGPHFRQSIALDEADLTASSPISQVAAVTPGFFRLLSAEILKGREFSEADRGDAPPVVLVNRSFERLYWPEEGALGRRIRSIHFSGEVVGVVDDIVANSLFGEPEPMVFAPSYQDDRHIAFYLFLRTRRGLAEIRERLAALVASPQFDLRLVSMTDIEEENARLLQPHEFSSYVLSALSAASLLLALLGVMGLLADLAARKQFEIGVRQALGARRSSIDWLLLKSILIPAAVGLAIGLGLSWCLPALLSDWLYDTGSGSWYFASVPAVLVLGVGAVGLYTIRRANRSEPADLLRTGR